MHIALISPYSLGTMRGNISTVRRISRFLTMAGVETTVLASDATSLEEMTAQLRPLAPTLIHAFHARYTGEISATLAEHFRIPFIITITGSDLYDPVLRDHPETVRVLSRAAAITCFSDRDAHELKAHFPDVAGRVTVLSQGVEILQDDGVNDFGIPDNAFVLLLPAALRPVKNVEFAISALSALREKDKKFQLVLAGGDIDHSYADKIRSTFGTTPWVKWLGEIPHDQMGSLYSRADLVLNCSHYEGMSNSLMEAMALGKPVVATDISGNRSLLRHGDTGWLFDGDSDFRALVTMLAADEALRREVGSRGRKEIKTNFSPHTEAKMYQNLYRNLCQKMSEGQDSHH